MFSEKASAIARMRQKCVKNASEMRQKCVKMGLVLLGKEERPKCVRNPSKLRQKCVTNARNTFGGEHLWADTNASLPHVYRLMGQKKKIVHKETCQSRFWGRGCDEALFSENKGFSVKRGQAIQ